MAQHDPNILFIPPPTPTSLPLNLGPKKYLQQTVVREFPS